MPSSDTAPSEVGPPSPFFEAWLPKLTALPTAADRPVADLACGRGRHALPAARSGLHVLALDRNASFLDALEHGRSDVAGLFAPIRCDLEGDPFLPLKPESCAAVLVFRFLFRPLCPAIEALLAPGGLLLYETFTVDQPSLGWGPKSQPFLLEAGELPSLFPGLETLSYEEGLRRDPKNEYRASLAARKPL